MKSSHCLNELTLNEIDAVSGAGLLGATVGNLLQFGVDVSNGVLNAVAPIGQALNLIPGVSPIHQLGDFTIATLQTAANGIGGLLGGTYQPAHPNHYQEEWGKA
ncbi:TPA: hypothetical protein ACIJ22_006327 [Pseudomonas aeruginosa]